MKVVIVEHEKQVVKKLIRVLNTIDDSIEILSVVDNLEMLQKRMSSPPFPHLVLVNRQLLGTYRNTIEAKLIITSGKENLVYLAFRAKNLQYLQKNLQKVKPAAGEDRSSLGPAGMAGEIIDNTLLHKAIKKRFLVSYQQKLLSIAVEEIAYFFSDNRFIFFKTFDNRKFLVEHRMDELETILDQQLFFRINRSYIISIHAITAILHHGYRFKISLTPAVEKEMIVSRERIANFKKWLGE